LVDAFSSVWIRGGKRVTRMDADGRAWSGLQGSHRKKSDARGKGWWQWHGGILVRSGFLHGKIFQWGNGDVFSLKKSDVTCTRRLNWGSCSQFAHPLALQVEGTPDTASPRRYGATDLPSPVRGGLQQPRTHGASSNGSELPCPALSRAHARSSTTARPGTCSSFPLVPVRNAAAL